MVAVITSGCARPGDDTLRLGLASAPVTLDPRFATDAVSTRVNRLLYARLVEFDARQLPVPGIATWQVITPTHYRFRLSPGETGRRFHNGEYLTAADVKATYDSLLDVRTASPHRATLALIEHVDVIDDNTVDFRLGNADPLFPAYLVIGILPARLLASGHAFRDQPLGSGPLRFRAWPEPGRLDLERVADHQALSIIHVADATVRVLKFIRGELDLLQNDLSPELVQFLEAREDVTVSRAPGSNFTYLGFNLEDPLTGNPLVRRAISAAIDRQAIIRYVMGNAARPAAALLPPEHWAGNPGLASPGHDPELAKSLLAQAGFTAQQPLRLSYKTSTDAFRVRLATVLQSQLKAVGIEVDLTSYDWGTLYGDIKAGNFQMYSLSWVGIKSPDIFRYVFHSDFVPPRGSNRGRYRNPQVDALINEAMAAGDLQVQAVQYRRLQGLLLEELPYVPLWYEDHVVAAHATLRGYQVGLDGDYDGLADVARVTANATVASAPRLAVH